MTRTVAFVIDALVIDGAAVVVGGAVALSLSLFYISSQAETILAAIGAAAWFVWAISYFIFFWSTTGETPGNRVMQIRVLDERTRRPIKPLRAAVRLGGMILAALPLFAGFVIMLWDERSRCLQDRLAHTVVMYVPQKVTAQRRAQAAASQAVEGRESRT